MPKWSAAVGRDEGKLVFTRLGSATPLIFPPGESWTYGPGLEWLGLALEKVTGQTLGEYMAERLFRPLGLHDTTFRPVRLAERIKDRYSKTAFRHPETGELIAGMIVLPTEPETDSGGAGLFTTAADYARVLQALLAGGEGLLKKTTVDLMFQQHLTDAQSTALQTRAEEDHCSRDPSEFAPSMPFAHGYGCLINLEDNPGKRHAGSARWEGLNNPIWVSTLSMQVPAVPAPRFRC